MLRTAVRVSITAIFVTVAVIAGHWVWQHYLYSPWTRDGRVRAEIITIAPDVSGWVTEVNFRDNEDVKKGQVLFTIDATRFHNAVEEARAKMNRARYAWEHAKEQYSRRLSLSKSAVISKDDLSTYNTNTLLAQADYELAKSTYQKTLIDLQRTEIIAPADGTIMNQSLRAGNYATQGKAVLSVVQKDSMYVTGYFEETKLPGIRPGDRARIELMSGGEPVQGKVISIARAIANNNTSTDSQLLPTTQQTFNWVRLAQRIPVDIQLTSVPRGVNLSAGMTVSVKIDHKG
ncbi:HlyD family secretion protein [Klebsiella pneumoniae]|uniref:efflux RND transporter periplasmic adaptor subunit n=1 Tax=Klebsiella pneumoniae TaxID=573 RepID=UPI000D744279|nr:HlyD family secretion protein [Klebsiella pneumoniae]PXI74659.1 HlyD family secretion protein [Klebsiella pneumoniae]RLK76830.1 HlyD family secretion protein [Klebsiella pneumoniae]RLK94295.1 HlyD family secretion protein [Klebsiella pneumoniae]HBU5918099.1 HlyD family secretion protein [Klebsiella pneumoniae]HCI6092822.1 HlyD family secretion protein [Klebsiella pneumoniae]